MPNIHRSPPKMQQASSMAQATPNIQDIDFHGDVVRLTRANNQDMVEDNQDNFTVIFKNKNAHVKRTISRTRNTLVPLESRTHGRLHADDIALLRSHIQKADSALNTLNIHIDEVGQGLDEEQLEPYIRESDAHIPTVLDLRARITALEDSMQESRGVSRNPAPEPKPKSVIKVDNTFRPRPLGKTATPAIFHKWKRELRIYVRRNGFEDAPLDEQRVLLNNCLTPEMEEALERICLPDKDDTLDQIVDSLEKHLTKSNNLMAKRFAYFNCVQKSGESITDYIIRFRNLGDYADFDKFMYNDNMVLRILTGTKDKALKRELFRLPKLDFDTVHQFALAWESSGVNADLVTDGVQNVDHSNNEEASVDKISTYKLQRKASFNAGPSRNNQNDRPKTMEAPQSKQHQSCFNCGNQKHPLASCPAKDRTCNYCGKLGHFSKVCRKSRNDKRKASNTHPVQAVEQEQEVQKSEDESSSSVGNFAFDVFNVKDSQDTRIQAPTPRIRASLSFSNKHLGSHDMVPDTGAALSVIPASLVRLWNISPDPLTTQRSLRGANGVPIQCIGTILLKVTLNDVTSDAVFFVCEDVPHVILSWLALKNLLVIRTDFPQQQVALVRQDHTHKVNQNSFHKFKAQCLHKFQSVFNDTLFEMRGAPMRIHLKDNFDPGQVRSVVRPRPVPVPLRDAVQGELDSLVSRGIIRPIQDPTDFVSPLVIVPKKNNTVRLVVDYSQLNKFIKRPSHPFPSVAEVRALIPSTAKFFATLDAVQGYLQIPLHEWGRFCFTRAPMGLSCSGDVFCAKGDQAFAGIPNIIKVVDDILIFADTEDQLYGTIDSVLKAASCHNISLSPTKFKISTEVDFVGLTISQDSISPDEKHYDAIANFPPPSNRTDLRSFLGMANQFSAFSASIARLAKPLRPLLSKASTWIWDASHQDAFDSLRKELVRSAKLHCFNPDRKTKLLTDASRLNGLGYALMQYDGDEWVLISCGSRFITETESNYAVFELEALAIVWAILKCRIFLLGLRSFQVVTDHRPLVTIFNSTRLSKTDNPRMLRLLQKISMYSFEVVWTPGKSHHIPDALSRAPVRGTHVINELEDDAQVRIHPDKAVLSMAEAASRDNKYQDIRHAVQSLPLNDVKRLPLSTHSHVRILASLWDRLSLDPGTKLVLLDSSRILVPTSQRHLVIDQIHAAHQGITRTKARMQSLYFWPGMANQVIQAVQSCLMCQKFRDQQPAQPIKPHSRPPRPFYATSMDIFEYKRSFFLTYVDRFSGWPSVAAFQKSPSSAQVISALMAIFKDFGIPNIIRHDGATPFVSEEFKAFMSDNNITRQLTSAYNPQSNGHAEASVKAMKLLVKKTWIRSSLDKQKFAEALLEWRNSPKYPGNLSPAEMVFGRKLRTRAPCITYKNVPNSAIMRAVKSNYDYMDKVYNSANDYRKTILPPLAPGDQVRIRNTSNHSWDKTAKVISARPGGQSYHVEAQGKILLRNRRLLMKIKND